MNERILFFYNYRNLVKNKTHVRMYINITYKIINSAVCQCNLHMQSMSSDVSRNYVVYFLI